MAWFSVKGIFRWYFKESGETERFEERIVLFKAPSFNAALEKAEIEAKEYCSDDPKANFSVESLGIFNAYSIGEEDLECGVEAFSETIQSGLPAEKYIDKYYPESGERS